MRPLLGRVEQLQVKELSTVCLEDARLADQHGVRTPTQNKGGASCVDAWIPVADLRKRCIQDDIGVDAIKDDC